MITTLITNILFKNQKIWCVGIIQMQSRSRICGHGCAKEDRRGSLMLIKFKKPNILL